MSAGRGAEEGGARLDERSATVTSRLVDLLNKLPGTEIPKAAGGKVLPPRGAIHAGDCIDTGDKASVKVQATEWAAFADALRAHARNVFRWDGSNRAAKEGIPTFFSFEIRSDKVTAREFQTTVFWEAGSWTPQAWIATALAGKR